MQILRFWYSCTYFFDTDRHENPSKNKNFQNFERRYLGNHKTKFGKTFFIWILWLHRIQIKKNSSNLVKWLSSYLRSKSEKIKTPIKIEAAPNFLSNFEQRYLDNHLTKFDKTFFLNSIASYNSNKKIFIEFSQVVVKISSLKVRKKSKQLSK